MSLGRSRNRFARRRWMIAPVTLVLLLACGFASPAAAMSIVAWPVDVTPDRACARIVLAGVLGDNWEVAVLDRASGQVLNLTRSLEDERAPAWSPDGRTIALTARRGSNWDVYALTLADGALHRLTDSPTYDGWPAWSHDGQQIAFESSRDGNLEIYTMPASGGPAVRITDEPAADIEPVWAADDNGLIIGSWRSGMRQLYAIDPATRQSTPITAPGEEARQPSLSPDGRHLAYVIAHGTAARIAVRDLDTGAVVEIRSSGAQQEWPAWQPGRSRGEPPALIALELAGGNPYRYPSGWTLNSSSGGLTDEWTRGLTLAGQWERPSCVPSRAPPARGAWQPAAHTRGATLEANPARGLVTLANVQALQPRLAASVAGSFQRLRRRALEASGYDVLSALNDAWRGIDHPAGHFLSWHKTGRAIDLRDWYAPGGRRALFIARQDLGGLTYFRIYLRAARQDGSQGTPLRESLWETEGRLANAMLTAAGGRALPPAEGYYVDFTDLAEREGWTRIPALTPPDGNWRRSYRDMEFWHYERRDGLSWYAAMRQVYDEGEIAARFTPELALRRGCTLEDALIAGIPGAKPELAHQPSVLRVTYAQRR